MLHRPFSNAARRGNPVHAKHAGGTRERWGRGSSGWRFLESPPLNRRTRLQLGVHSNGETPWPWLGRLVTGPCSRLENHSPTQVVADIVAKSLGFPSRTEDLPLQNLWLKQMSCPRFVVLTDLHWT